MFAALHLVHLLTVRRRSYLHSAKPGAATRNLSGGWKNDHYHPNCDCLNCLSCAHPSCGRYYRNRCCGRRYILHTSRDRCTNPSSVRCCNLRCSRHTSRSSSLHSYAAAKERCRSDRGDMSCCLRSYATAMACCTKERCRSAQGDTSCWSHSGHSHKSCRTHFARCREA